MTFHVVIPARLKSSRLSEKVLADIGGKTMLQRVYEQACQSEASSVTIATDEPLIQTVAQSFGATVILTGEHPNGTARLAEAIPQLGLPEDAVIVNLQGDEPFMPPTLLNQVAALCLRDPLVPMATLCYPIDNPKDCFDPNVVKVVFASQQSQALYFSRAPIPWLRDVFAQKPIDFDPKFYPFFRHIGLYAYRSHFIQTYIGLAPTPLEQAENLEQLRVLEAGYQIAIEVAQEKPALGVDTLADLTEARRIAQQRFNT